MRATSIPEALADRDGRSVITDSELSDQIWSVGDSHFRKPHILSRRGEKNSDLRVGKLLFPIRALELLNAQLTEDITTKNCKHQRYCPLQRGLLEDAWVAIGAPKYPVKRTPRLISHTTPHCTKST